MNMANDGSGRGIAQYCFPHCYELSGKRFNIIAEGKEYELSFEGRDLISFSENGTSEYECLKLDKATYFVTFGVKTCFAVLDLDQSLCTLMLPGFGYIFGAIERRWKPLPERLHGFSDDLTGTGVRWVFGYGKYTDHACFKSDRIRYSWSPEDSEFMNVPSKYVKIKDGMYLVFIIGDVPETSCAPDGCSRLVLLEDYERMMCVGCAFGDTAKPVMLSGYGKFIDMDPALFEK